MDLKAVIFAFFVVLAATLSPPSWETFINAVTETQRQPPAPHAGAGRARGWAHARGGRLDRADRFGMITTLPHQVNELAGLVDRVRTTVAAHAGWADTPPLGAGSLWLWSARRSERFDVGRGHPELKARRVDVPDALFHRVLVSRSDARLDRGAGEVARIGQLRGQV
jgi:hypothetical protein